MPKVGPWLFAARRRLPLNPDTLESILSKFFAIKDEWLKSTARVTMLDILTRNRPEAGWQIKEAVVIALGQFCTETP